MNVEKLKIYVSLLGMVLCILNIIAIKLNRKISICTNEQELIKTQSLLKVLLATGCILTTVILGLAGIVILYC